MLIYEVCSLTGLTRKAMSYYEDPYHFILYLNEPLDSMN
jgi:hypothetical protein